MRIKIIFYVVVIFLLLIVGQLMYVQILRGHYYYNLSKNNRIRVIPLEGKRGRIFDRNGQILADSRLSYNVIVVPQDTEHVEDIFDFLSQILEIDRKILVNRYRQLKFSPFAPVNLVQDISRLKAIKIEESLYQFPGLFVQESYKRYYPLERNSAHAIGYVSKANRMQLEKFKEYGYSPQSIIGYEGVEAYYDDQLSGGDGGLQIEVNSRGQQMRILGLRRPSSGKDLVMTVDSQLQQVASNLLNSRPGAVVVMDVDTGEILTLVSSPDFNPNDFVNPSSRDNLNNLFSSAFSPLVDRAVGGVYPPGSVFKIPEAICAVDNHKIDDTTSFNCEGAYMLGESRFKCTHVHGRQDLIQAIAHSCNVYFYHVGLLVQPDLLSRYAHLFGLGSLTYIDLPGEKKGLVPSPAQRLLSSGRRWFKGDTLNFSIGQGDMLATPLQLTRMMATISRDGVEVQPHIINDDIKTKSHNIVRQINIDKKVFDLVKEGMRSTITDITGTAHDLAGDNYFIAGKTGTAQSYGHKEEHAWFAGYIKGSQRQLSFCVFLEHGGSSHNAVAITQQLLHAIESEGLLGDYEK